MSNATYNPKEIEARIWEFWERGRYFHAEPGGLDAAGHPRKPFSIVIPPPNVTGSLHLGHAINNTLQDILIRTKRMQGYNACWLPGTDHAGIATQAVVEKRLRDEQKFVPDRKNPEHRELVIKKIWEWKEEYNARILGQLRTMGCSCDWERTRFTLDEGCVAAVYELFFRFFKEGLIYRGTRLVNWDTQLQTAVADDEVYYETVRGNIWHIRYPVENSQPSSKLRGASSELNTADSPAKHESSANSLLATHHSALYLIVATTRPETMLADTAVAVHPDDPRYQHLIGKQVVLPLTGRTIPVIADPILVNKEFGTGCVKVTPGHDPNDYACYQRHPQIGIRNMMTPDGRVDAANAGLPADEAIAGSGSAAGAPGSASPPGRYAGLKLDEARKRVVADLEAAGLLDKVEPYETEVGHSDRSKTAIQPFLSEQWFLKMGDDRLAEPALEAVRDGRVRFFPERFAKSYLDWLGEKRDWCISRQLWWGHRIPVWRLPLNEFDPTRTIALLGEYLREVGVSHETFVSGKPSDDPNYGTNIYLCASGKRAERALAALNCWYQVGKFDPALKEQYRDVLITKRAEELAAAIMSGPAADQIRQDPDVLDTWFSSMLWPFSTFGWPDRGDTDGGGSADDLGFFYPTSVLSTARDIISLWVVRMVLSGLYCTQRVPFQHVFIHPTIQDAQGRRMSKSLGNGVDPLDLIELFGSDAMRFTLASMAGDTQDVRIPVQPVKLPDGRTINSSDRFELGRNFCNKLWNAANGVVFANINAAENSDEATERRSDEGEDDAAPANRTAPVRKRFDADQSLSEQRASHSASKGDTATQRSTDEASLQRSSEAAVALYRPRSLERDALPIEDQWILSRLEATIEEAQRDLDHYQFSALAGRLYGFFWNDFCDWYVELAKPRLFERVGEAFVRRSDDSAAAARQVLVWVLDQSLRLLHPIMPFITEELWRRLNELAPLRGIEQVERHGAALVVAAWPEARTASRRPEVERGVGLLQRVITALRDTLARINTNRSAAKQPAIGKLPAALLHVGDAALLVGLVAQKGVIERLGRCERVEIGAQLVKPAGCASHVLSGVDVFVPLAGLMDVAAERARLEKELAEARGALERLDAKLANEGFVAKAPPAVIEQERTRQSELRSKIAGVERNLHELA